jgi:NAD(P)-dependent dehydrogenase (short-subunit alcohol dehydrogenase family)
MNAMTASMAKAVAAEGITVNAVSPGTIRTSTLEHRFREAAKERGFKDADTPWEDIERTGLPIFAQVPVGRVGDQLRYPVGKDAEDLIAKRSVEDDRTFLQAVRKQFGL